MEECVPAPGFMWRGNCVGGCHFKPAGFLLQAGNHQLLYALVGKRLTRRPPGNRRWGELEFIRNGAL